MARKTLFAVLGAASLSIGYAQGSTQTGTETAPAPTSLYRNLTHNAFKPGEKLGYVVHYGILNAGRGTLELQNDTMSIGGRTLLHAVVKGRSVGAFNTFYKVDYRFDTRFDEAGVFPWIFNRHCDDNGYRTDQDYNFMQHRHTVVTQEQKSYKVPPNVQDMISAFYYARTWDLTNVQKDQEFTVDLFIDNEVWPMRMKYVGKETIKIRNGKYRCLKFQPKVQKGRVFKDDDDLNVWVSDDGNRIPILAQAEIVVGKIKMELTDYEGLAHPLAKE